MCAMINQEPPDCDGVLNRDTEKLYEQPGRFHLLLRVAAKQNLVPRHTEGLARRAAGRAR